MAFDVGAAAECLMSYVCARSSPKAKREVARRAGTVGAAHVLSSLYSMNASAAFYAFLQMPSLSVVLDPKGLWTHDVKFDKAA
jgi:hypothetical protein